MPPASGAPKCPQVRAYPSVWAVMNELRRDIGEAMSRMQVTFGARGAAKNLHESLEAGETVLEMVACVFAGGEGVAVLTDRRVLAVRDDYGAFRLQDVALADAYAVDYAPRIHDGLGVSHPQAGSPCAA